MAESADVALPDAAQTRYAETRGDDMETLTLNIDNPVILNALADAERQGVAAQSYLLGLVQTAARGNGTQPGNGNYSNHEEGLSAEALQAADERLFAFSGAATGSVPYSSDNEKIDADLARAYGDNHAALYQPQS